jgi:hypothetical protein
VQATLAVKTARVLPGRLAVAALEQPRYSKRIPRSLGCAVLGFRTAEVTRMCAQRFPKAGGFRRFWPYPAVRGQDLRDD